MVRKMRTARPGGDESFQSQEAKNSGGGGRGVQHPIEGASPPVQQGIRRGICQGGRWWAPQSQQGGRGGYTGEKRYPQGVVVFQPHGGMTPQQQGVPHQQTGGAILDSDGHHCSGDIMTSDHGGTPSSYGGSSRPLSSELHQVTQAPYGGTMTLREHHHANQVRKAGVILIRAFRWASH